MLRFLNDTVLERHVDIHFSLKIKDFKDFQQNRSSILHICLGFLNFFFKETDWIITTVSKIPWTDGRGETQSFLNIYCPPLLYLNCNFHTSLRHPLGATLAEDERSRKAEVEAPGLAADCLKSELHLSVIHSLDISIFPISDMNCDDAQECMTVKKTILCLLCCWAFWCPQRAGSSVEVTSA